MPRKSGASATDTAANATEPPVSPTLPHDNKPTDAEGAPAANDPQSTPAKTPRSSRHDDTLGIDDLLLPRTLISRPSRGTLPPNTSIQKDALLALTKAATVFISHLASTANEMTTRKTIAPENVLKALVEMELQGVMELGKRETAGDEVEGEMPLAGRLERELAAFENSVRGKRKGYRERVKKREDDGKGVGGSSPVGGKEGDEGEPEAKRARVAADDDGEAAHSHVNGNGDESAVNPRAVVNGATTAGRSADGQSPNLNGDETEDELDEEDDGPVPDEDDEPEDQDDDAEEDEDEDEAGSQSREDEDALGLDRDPDDYGPNAQLRREALDGEDEDRDEMSD